MPSSVPDFAESLGRCERSAVHLEMRDSYAPTDRFEAWKRGERIDWEDRASEPVSDYIRWEHCVTRARGHPGRRCHSYAARPGRAVCPCL